MILAEAGGAVQVRTAGAALSRPRGFGLACSVDRTNAARHTQYPRDRAWTECSSATTSSSASTTCRRTRRAHRRMRFQRPAGRASTCSMRPTRRASAHSCARRTTGWPRSATTSAPIAQKYPDYRFYPCMPYAHKYANAATEHGMVDALRKFLPEDGAVSAMFRGGVALASKDIEAHPAAAGRRRDEDVRRPVRRRSSSSRT